MAVASSTSASGLSVTSLSLDLPLSNASQILFAQVCFWQTTAGVPTVTTPSGWTLMDTEAVFTTQCQGALFWKVGDASTGVTFAFSAACHATASCELLTNVRSSSPYEMAAVAFRGPTTVFSSNSLTTTLANETLTGIWMGYPLTPSFSPESPMNFVVGVGGGESGSLPPLMVAEDFQATAGATGSKRADTSNYGAGTVWLIGWKPDNRPSVPLVTFANGGEALTAGATVTLTCTASTSPTAAQSSLKYDFDYSLNNGTTWTNIGLSSAGVPSKAWTVSSTLGNSNLIRVRSNDPSGGLFSAVYDVSDAAFSIVAETTPGKPVITSPTNGQLLAKSATQTVTWIHQGGAGNPQVAFTAQWATNSAFSGATTIGPTTTGTQSTSFDTTGLADGTVVYFHVKTQGVSIYSEYSSTLAFTVASAPATPNITAPTAGSPPTSAYPTVTFTEASDFVARRFRVVASSVEVLNQAVTSTALAFTSPYAFANGVAVTIYLSVTNLYGLSSAEDSETVTPSYTGPAVPTVTYNANSTSGFIGISITNSDTPSYNEVWRYKTSETRAEAIRVATNIPADGNFEDHNVESVTQYFYFIRAYSGSLFTDSADSSAQEVLLTNMHIHAISRTGLSNAMPGLNISVMTLQEGSSDFDEDATNILLLGRSNLGTLSGQATWQKINVHIHLNWSEEATRNALLAIWRAQQKPINAIVRLRDQFNNAIFCRISQPIEIKSLIGYDFTFLATEINYIEEV